MKLLSLTPKVCYCMGGGASSAPPTPPPPPPAAAPVMFGAKESPIDSTTKTKAGKSKLQIPLVAPSASTGLGIPNP